MSRGGIRSGAGRPPGAKSGTGKARRRRNLTATTGPSPAELKHARDRARDWLLHNETALIDRFMAGDDDRLKLEVWKTLKAYGDGRPTEHLEITARKSPEQLLEEIARKRFAITSVEQVEDGAHPSLAPVKGLITGEKP